MPRKQKSLSGGKLSRNDEQRLARLRRALTKEYLAKQQGPSEMPEFSERPDDWIARRLYRELKRLVLDGNLTVLEQIVAKQRSLTGGPHPVAGKPFKLGLIVLLSDRLNYSRNRQMELSNAMEYAFRHNVPSKHFSGFIKQAGQKQIAKKLKVGHTEPGFKLREAE